MVGITNRSSVEICHKNSRWFCARAALAFLSELDFSPFASLVLLFRRGAALFQKRLPAVTESSRSINSAPVGEHTCPLM